PYDVNLDHKTIFRSALVACRPQPNCCVKTFLTFHVNSATEWGMASDAEKFSPNVYIDISEFLDRKIEALSIYKEELRPYPHPRSLEAVRGRARVFGAEIGMESAEAFHLIYSRVAAV